MKKMKDILADAYRIDPCATGRLSEKQEGWTVWAHKKWGNSVPSTAHVLKPFLFRGQLRKKNPGMKGERIFDLLSRKSVAGIGVHDALLRNRSILDVWCPPNPDPANVLGLRQEIRYFYFWGTIFEAPDERLYVKHLYCMLGVWRSSSNSLNCLWGNTMPAVLLG